jgi:hypothetical protein
MSREEAIQRMRARHVLTAIRSDPYPVTGPWSLRASCDHSHGWRNVDEYWLQCVMCWWCKPKLGKPPSLRVLPAFLKGRVLPPLTDKVNVNSVFKNAGFVLDEDSRSVLSIVRVHVVQSAFIEDPMIRRCGVEVKFKKHGWRMAAVFHETALYKLISVLSRAAPRKPKKLWLAIQAAFSKGWRTPWL